MPDQPNTPMKLPKQMTLYEIAREATWLSPVDMLRLMMMLSERLKLHIEEESVKRIEDRFSSLIDAAKQEAK